MTQRQSQGVFQKNRPAVPDDLKRYSEMVKSADRRHSVRYSLLLYGVRPRCVFCATRYDPAGRYTCIPLQNVRSQVLLVPGLAV